MLAQLFGVPVALAASGSSEPTNKEKDERCLMGGWGKDTQCAGMKFKKSDPMTSWTELKAYQARTIQDYSINCIGKYEKLYATGNAEGKALMRAGGVYERNICSKRNKDGTSSNCGNNNSSNSGGSGNNKGSSNSNKEFRERRQQEWPLAFRGQMCNKKDFDEDQKKDCQKRQCFPFFGAQKGKCPTLKTGLDDAKPGDMILMFAGGAKEGGSDKPLMPTIAFVKYSHNNANTKDSTPCSESKNCHLIVESADDGQFPDACGNSTSWGVSQSRTLYKPGNMPEIYKKAVKDIQQKNNVKNPSTSCVNAQFGACEYDDWDKAKLYRPTDDVRDDEPS
jgi:hypothetical protein